MPYFDTYESTLFSEMFHDSWAAMDMIIILGQLRLFLNTGCFRP